MSNSKKYVILDTDCGIDDALAIILATFCHKNSLIDILAITCTHGNTSVDNVCKNVCYTLRASDLEKIKTYRGCDGPIIGKHEKSPHYGDDGLGDVTKDLPPITPHIETEHAVNALIRLSKQYPKQITVIALGPITNIAMAFMLDNKFFTNLEQLVFMGGTTDYIGNVEPGVEFNVSCDPESCHILLTKADCPLTIVPWECGLGNLLTWEIYEQISKLNSEKAKFAQKILTKDYERVKSHGTDRKGLILCDILAVVAAVYQSLIEKTETHPTAIELRGQLTRGQLVSDKRSGFTYTKQNGPDVKFVTHFNQQKLMNLIMNFLK